MSVNPDVLPIDVTESGELLDLAEEVRRSGVGRLLVRGDEELALLTPVSSDRDARPRRPADEQCDALLNIIGIGESGSEQGRIQAIVPCVPDYLSI